MGSLVASVVIGAMVHIPPVDKIPNDKRREEKLPTYAVYERNRLIAWRRVTDYDKRSGRPKGTYTEPVYLN